MIEFPVEASHILMFARSIGDTNPAYAVGAASIAPPTFPQAVAQFDPNYSLRPTPGKPWFGSGATPTGLAEKPTTAGGLHAEMHFEYHRPIRPGDMLTVTTRAGESWQKDSKRAGRLTFHERIAEYRDAAGALVVTARNISVITERPVSTS